MNGSKRIWSNFLTWRNAMKAYFGSKRLRGRDTWKQSMFGVFEREGSVYTGRIPDSKRDRLRKVIVEKVSVDAGYDKYVRINKSVKIIITLLAIVVVFQRCGFSQNHSIINSSGMDSLKKNNPVYSNSDTSKVILTDEEWRKLLPNDIYYVARQKGTEGRWSSKYEKFFDKGIYYCAACGNALFKSDTKFESGCGWPSFYEPINKSSIVYTPDNSHGMIRTEVQCGRCKSHLGHVFEDGPPPTGLRYCINGVVLDFDKAKEAEKKYNDMENKKPKGE